jgi:hypothetical protein
LGTTAGLDVCEKFSPNRASIPGPCSVLPVSIPIELSRHKLALKKENIIQFSTLPEGEKLFL